MLYPDLPISAISRAGRSGQPSRGKNVRWNDASSVNEEKSMTHRFLDEWILDEWIVWMVQALTNSKLAAIRDELRALNQKAAGAASVAPPSGPSSGQGR